MAKERPKREGIMLCHPAEGRKLIQLGEPFFIQPKLKGERCRIEWFHNDPVLFSSQGNIFKYMEHIEEAIRINFFSNKVLLDGELYVHGWSEDKIRSVANRKTNKHPEVHLLEFHIFDYQTPEAQWMRIQRMNQWQKEGRFESPLRLVLTGVGDFSNWQERTLNYIGDGYEGIIIRHPMAFYETKRSPYILKFKPTELDTYTITGFTEGEGWAEGHLGAFLVQGDDGTTFKVGSGKLLTKERRSYFWSIREELIGRQLIVKHEKLKTSGGIPVCAVAYDIKLD
jgi:ATP-dependent DNA ligase